MSLRIVADAKVAVCRLSRRIEGVMSEEDLQANLETLQKEPV